MSQTLETGDLFEISEREWIRASIPLYERVWSEFIGHDGHGTRRMGFRDAPADLVRRHSMFCQAHYSMALFLCLFDRSTDEALKSVALIPEGKPLTAAAYLKLTQDTSTFLALMGQVCDMVEIVGETLRANYIYEPIAKFMAERNNSIHGARLPMGTNYLGLYVAKIATREKQPGYNNDKLWEEVNSQEYHYIVDWYGDTKRSLIDVLANQVYPAIAANAKKEFCRVEDLTRPGELEKGRITFTSNPYHTTTPAISGSMNPPSTYR